MLSRLAGPSSEVIGFWPPVINDLSGHLSDFSCNMNLALVRLFV